MFVSRRKHLLNCVWACAKHPQGWSADAGVVTFGTFSASIKVCRRAWRVVPLRVCVYVCVCACLWLAYRLSAVSESRPWSPGVHSAHCLVHFIARWIQHSRNSPTPWSLLYHALALSLHVLPSGKRRRIPYTLYRFLASFSGASVSLQGLAGPMFSKTLVAKDGVGQPQ